MYVYIHFTISLRIHKIVMEPKFFRPLNRVHYLHILNINAPKTVWKQNSKFMNSSEEDLRD